MLIVVVAVFAIKGTRYVIQGCVGGSGRGGGGGIGSGSG